MDRNLIQSQLGSLIRGHVPSNARKFKYSIHDGTPKQSGLGFYVDPDPFDGVVIAKTEDAIVLKTGRTTFAVLDRALVTEDPDQGVKLHVEPYARRRFDGLRADTPEERTDHTADGVPYTVKSYILGSAPAPLPIPKPKCPELAQLIEQLEKLPAPDGFRRITHMLVDAGAKDFSWVDPTPDNIIKTPPSISFNVDTMKFSGGVTVLYDRGADVYVVELHGYDGSSDRVEDVYFDMLGETLEHLIDDGNWRSIRVQSVPDRKSAPATVRSGRARVATAGAPSSPAGASHGTSL